MRASRRSRPLSACQDAHLIAAQSSPNSQASRREQAVLLADALEDLPEDYREVIILRQLEGLSFPDVARRVGRTEDSVKNVWLRALARLRLRWRTSDELGPNDQSVARAARRSGWKRKTDSGR